MRRQPNHCADKPHARIVIFSAVLMAVLMLAGCGSVNDSVAQDAPLGALPAATNTTPEEQPMATILLETTKGNITIELAADMPITAGNFKTLVEKGFYNGVVFHRIIPGFMAQGGDPTGSGRGGPGYTIKDEFTNHNRNDRGTISMANAGPNTGGSQFFLNVANNNFLDSKHPVFGKVTQGMDVVDAIVNSPRDRADQPMQEIKIVKASVVQ